MHRQKTLGSMIVLAMLLLAASDAVAQKRRLHVFPEQRRLQVRQPEQLPTVGVPSTASPFTVASESDGRIEQKISLDEAIQIALVNANVIRVLTGLSASSSGRTIYDVAISNTGIDEANSVFDPSLVVNSTWNRTHPSDGLVFPGFRNDAVNTSVGLSKRMFNGGTAGFNFDSVGTYFEAGVPLDPEIRSIVELSLRQPLMRGYGRAANLAPVIVARIDTERSYFQYKDSVQELVRGVIAGYWNLVASRVDVWARRQQIEQADFAFRRAVARKEHGLDRAADVAQARSALANFNAALITARSNLILSETALRNILGMEPSSDSVFVPTSLPVMKRLDFDWNEIVALAELYRPDIIELKLILEADEQLLQQADNQAKPLLDGIANYRWNGFTGVLPNGSWLPNQPGSGFNLGVNFSVPLGLRQGRAALRRRQLLLARDRTNLDQGIFQMVQDLTINYRNLDQFFEQYIALREARDAARLSFENQVGEVAAGRREFINALQAITDWGNAVSQEARSITQYNTELANIERETGTILETHGIRFFEERYGSLGPRSLFGAFRTTECYPSRIDLGGSTDRYPDSENSSDDSFNMQDLDVRGTRDVAPPERNTDPPSELRRPASDAGSAQPPGLGATSRRGKGIAPLRIARKRLLDLLR